LPAVAKTAISGLFHWTGLDRWESLPEGRRMPVVLGYHRVVEDCQAAAKHSIPAMLISSKMFEGHLDLLARQYRFISLEEAADMVQNGKPLERPAAAITFDDGYNDVYQSAFPILKRKGIPAAVFVVTSLIDTDQVPLHDRLYALFQRLLTGSPSASWVLHALLRRTDLSYSRATRLVRQSGNPYSATRSVLVSLSQRQVLQVIAALEATVGDYRSGNGESRAMTWEMLAEMQRAGVMIGSHTQTHALLPNEGREKALEELKDSRAQLESHLGRPILHLAYPDGGFCADTLSAAAAAGYRYAYTTCRHRDARYPLLTIPRTVLWERSWVNCRGDLSASIMNCHLTGLFDWVSGCTQDHRSRAAALPQELHAQLAER
jgi:peptidoglycan/xylan/chitin deacetylase (PgdA/CDA1 family)